MELRQDLARLLGRDVDVIDLGQASPVLAMQVLRHGRLLVDVDPRRRRRFVAGVPGRHEDLKIGPGRHRPRDPRGHDGGVRFLPEHLDDFRPFSAGIVARFQL
jgi:hypothetical protein